MIRSMYTAATGMKAQQLRVDNISNNLANVNTVGFKKSKLEFQDLLYQTLRQPGEQTSDRTMSPTGLQVGLGVKAAANQRAFGQGSLVETQNPMDVAIQGDGFFQILRPDGSVTYTRDGSFKISGDGVIVTADGYSLEPEITVPEDASEVNITSGGQIEVSINGQKIPEEIGQIELAKFVNPAGLKAIGGNLYQTTIASGDAVVGIPGTEQFGDLKQRYLETSNVEVVGEMIDLITSQRAYEITSKAIQTSEEMLQIANQLKR